MPTIFYIERVFLNLNIISILKFFILLIKNIYNTAFLKPINITIKFYFYIFILYLSYKS